MLGDQVRGEHRRVPGQGRHHDRRLAVRSGLQARTALVTDVAEVDQGGRPGQPQVHHRNQALPAGDDLGLLAPDAEQLDGLGPGVGALVLERRRLDGSGGLTHRTPRSSRRSRRTSSSVTGSRVDDLVGDHQLEAGCLLRPVRRSRRAARPGAASGATPPRSRAGPGRSRPTTGRRAASPARCRLSPPVEVARAGDPVDPLDEAAGLVVGDDHRLVAHRDDVVGATRAR